MATPFAARRGGHRRHVARLYPQVEFLAQSAGEPGGEPGGADRPAPARAALQPGRQPTGDIQVSLDCLADIRTAYLDHHPGAGQQSRRVDLGDGRGGDRLPVEAGEQLVHLRSQFGPQHLLDRGPGNSDSVVLQAAQLADELGREKITAGGQHLPELDESDPAVLHGQSDRAGQPGPALRRGQLRPAPAPLVGQQPAPREDPGDLPVAPGPAYPPSRGAQHVDRPGHRPAGHQRLGDDQEDHADQQRNDHPEDHEPQGRQRAALLGKPRAADHGRDDRREHQHRDDRGDQRAQRRQAHSDQPAHPEREQKHRQGSSDDQHGPG